METVFRVFSLMWLVSLIAFIVYWRKKASARKAAGEGYQSDPEYLSVSKTKRIIGIVCIVSFIIAGALTPKSDDSGKNTAATQPSAMTASAPTEPPKQDVYAEANINQLLQEAKDNAAKANRAYKGKKVKIVGGAIKNIDSDVNYITVDSASAGLLEYGMLYVMCNVRDKKLKDKVLDFKKEQPVIIYGTIREVGDLIGYSLNLENIEPTQ